ncbi:thioesterase II family protein [Pseudoduganella buxea]|uniref:Alpha/beta fold hydrolase n=1 Tax=Pseudoduganella buxea TaxID=1949069 RepID=A0A6I3T2W8_9BURK|nr:alpha/beta fold hydrolase [Pseudoduganella buxea]MTV55754.1 alpha/beta fold hydrolase [Pseudoduganella buxea]GGC24963.1 thioesterase [Pseudoduganella buxea]
MMLSKWFVRYGAAQPQAPRLLVACHFAGGAASAFRQWPALLAGEAECISVQLPGRETRIDEPFCLCLDTVAKSACDAIATVARGRPVSLFGHSMGALIALAIAQQVQRAGSFGLDGLAVSARRAPHLPVFEPDLLHCSDATLLECLRAFDGLPPEVLDEPELKGKLLDRVRADFVLADAGRRLAPPERGLHCPLLALGGVDDQTVGLAHLLPWQRYTASAFKLALMPGGHFYLRAPSNMRRLRTALLDFPSAVSPSQPL